MVSSDKQAWAYAVVRPLYLAAAHCKRPEEWKEMVRRAAVLEVRLLEGEPVDALPIVPMS